MSSSTLVVAAVGPTGSTPQEPTNDVFFILDGGFCRTRRQRSLGARHRRPLKPQW
jgi:hypothetical protein